MFLVTSQLITEARFTELGEAVEISVNRALVKGGAILLNAVIAEETRVGDASPKRRVSPGVHLRDSFHIEILKARFWARAFGRSSSMLIVWTPNPNAIWQELGTRGSRRKALKPRTIATGRGGHTPGNRGVTPLYFMRRGFAKAQPEVEALLVLALANVGEFGGGSVLHDTASTSFLADRR